MYETVRSQRKLLKGTKFDNKRKKGRAHLSRRTIQKGSSDKGYDLIRSLHKMFLDRSFSKKVES